MKSRTKKIAANINTASESAAPDLFSKQFFADLHTHDLELIPAKTRAKMAQSLWQLAQQRNTGKPELRIFNPDKNKTDWELDHTVLEIINDDMPFLVDSVTGELQRRGFTIHFITHPVVWTSRDKSGKLQSIAAKSAKVDSAFHPESMIQLYIDRCLDEKILKEIKTDILSILSEVRSCVKDWKAMRQQALDSIASLHKSSHHNEAEVEETKTFLQWLTQDNFTFLGYRELAPLTGGKNFKWDILPNKSLGLLSNDALEIFGGLRKMEKQPDSVAKFMREPRLVIVTKTNLRSRVHRPVAMDAIFVKKLNEAGETVTERLFVGLFTSASYAQNPHEVPYIRQKINQVMKRSGFEPSGHNGKVLANVLDTYPRDELFQISNEQLFNNSLGIVALQERSRVALFMRKDPFSRFVTCLIYIPRERYDSAIRHKIQSFLEVTLQGKLTDYSIRIDDGLLASLFMTFAASSEISTQDQAKIEKALRELCRAWPDRLRDRLVKAHGEAGALQLLQRYGNSFPNAYCDVISTTAAVGDVLNLEKCVQRRSLVVDLSLRPNSEQLSLKLFQPDRHLVLSEVLPLIENMGLKIDLMNGPYEITPKDTQQKIFIHEFVGLPMLKALRPLDEVKAMFAETLTKVWQNEAGDDAFNALTILLGIDWRKIVMLRAFARYLRQLRIPYGDEMIAKTFQNYPQITLQLVDLFAVKFDPDYSGDRTKNARILERSINEATAQISVIEEDRIIRRYLNLMQSLLRTNFFQTDENGNQKSYLSLKFNSRAIDYMPLPKPWVEIFVYSQKVEGVHLRGGKVARGGIRWSDRRDDFRNEILGLMKAQMVKNSVIVPVGSKGGFIVKRPAAEPEKFRAEGVECYRTFMRGLLDLTDNRINGKIVPPKRVICHDEADPYLVVAADKGTATFSDIANNISQEYNFWLDDAFASGGSVGYDHKQMGITARGAWEAVKRHFRELGKDIQREDFTCIGVGDMSGDVFGNGMLLSKHIHLIGAFDHRHIFCDPNPDAATSFTERQRMFKLPRSSWADYDTKKISKGGGVFSRTEKVLKLTPEIKASLGLTSDTLSPNDLIQAMLRAEIDLLYFGGIGTYVKASDETHEEVGERASEPLRINGNDVNAKVVGEGANLGFTQRGRIEFAIKGGRINTDAIDNSAGVSTSDHEVNIKILLSKPMSSGQLSFAARNKLLASMTDEVAALVLRDNYRQTQTLSEAVAHATELLPLHTKSIRMLEKSGLLNRKVEFLPDEVELAERQRSGYGLTRPELAVLLAYSKIWLYEQLLKSDLLEDDFLRADLLHYFPTPLQKKYSKEITEHQLGREIIATDLTNGLINRSGCHFIPQLMEQTGQEPATIAKAYMLVRAAYHLPLTYRQIEQLDNKVPAATQLSMLSAMSQMLYSVVSWLLTHGKLPAKLTAPVESYRDATTRLSKWLQKAPEGLHSSIIEKANELISVGVPKNLAQYIANLPYLSTLPNLLHFSEVANCSIERVADIYFGLGQRLQMEWLRSKLNRYQSVNPWQRELVGGLLEDITNHQRNLMAVIIGDKTDRNGKKTVKGTTGEQQLAVWLAKNQAKIDSYDAMLSDLQSMSTLDLTMLTLASRQLGGLVV